MTVVVLKQRQPAEKRIPRKWAVRFPLEITLSAAQHPWEEHLTRIPTQHRLEPSFGESKKISRVCQTTAAFLYCMAFVFLAIFFQMPA